MVDRKPFVHDGLGDIKELPVTDALDAAVAFTPDTPGNWNPVPTNISEAMNQVSISVKDFIDSGVLDQQYFEEAGPNSITNITTFPEQVVNTIVCVAEDDAGLVGTTLAGKYFILADAAGTVAFWYSHNGATEPVHGAARSVEISTLVTGDLATVVATKTAVALDLDVIAEALPIPEQRIWQDTQVATATITVNNRQFGLAGGAVSAGDSTFTVSATTPTTNNTPLMDYDTGILVSGAAYIIHWCVEWTTSSNNKSNDLRVVWDSDTVTPIHQGQQSPETAGNYGIESAFFRFEPPSTKQYSIRIEHRLVTTPADSFLKDAKVHILRLAGA
jgi:hypothetical protein